MNSPALWSRSFAPCALRSDGDLEMREIDSMGKRCPQPIIDLARAMKIYAEEKEFTLLSDDPATMSDLTAWSRMTHHQLTQIGESKFLIVRGI